MKYIRGQLDYTIEEATVITLGKFDGLHRGHELLMENLFAQKDRYGLKTVVFTFDIPPQKAVEEKDGRVLTTNEEKRYIFERTGLDYLYECPFTREVMCMEPEEFIAWIVKAFSVKCIVVGRDFHFGHERAGDYQVLQQFSKKYEYRVIVLDKVQEDGRDISSTFVRERIVAGDISKANHLLGYEFFVKSEVIHGRQLGRTIGIPTINMAFPKTKLLPPNGVYATLVDIDGILYGGVTNVGTKPTVGAHNALGVETYILDYSGDLYDQQILVKFLDFIRPEQKFASVDALKQQIDRDVLHAKALLGREMKA